MLLPSSLAGKWFLIVAASCFVHLVLTAVLALRWRQLFLNGELSLKSLKHLGKDGTETEPSNIKS